MIKICFQNPACPTDDNIPTLRHMCLMTIELMIVLTDGDVTWRARSAASCNSVSELVVFK